jgi:CSLREA domain-containing protein
MAGRSFPNAGQDLLRAGFLIVLLASLSLLTPPASPVQAAVITATTLADEVLDDGFCSLREAILNAENDNQSGSTDCAAGSNADSISFSGISGTITLGSNLDYIDTAITIEGSGNVTLSGTNVRVFYITYSGNVTLNNLRIQNSHAYNGAGIMNDGRLTLNNSTVSNNTAEYYGGGIWNRYGTTTLNNSTVSNNTAGNGAGGIYNGSTYSAGTVNLNNSTISGNLTGTDGGGGIYNSAGTVTITNSTLAGNRATANGGGIYNRSGTVTLGNTIIANSSSGGDCVNSATINPSGSNLIEDGSCGFPVGGDPLLGAFTGAYFPLLSGSPAIDVGDNGICPTIDQRGVTRPQDGNGDGSAICDLGSYELLPPPSVTINQAAGQADPTNTSPITFEVVFSENVTGFGAADISFTGSTAGGALSAIVTGSGANYTAEVSGMSGTGVVNAAIPAGAAMDIDGNLNAASTSIDDSVTFDNVPPTVTINQAPGQADPTDASPIRFDIQFSEVVIGFDATDISFAGSTVGGTLSAVVTGSAADYTVEVSGMSGMGTVVVSIPAGAGMDIAGNSNLASTSTDNSVTFDDTTPQSLTVTINQAPGQADPTNTSPIIFEVVFSEDATGFDAADVSFTGSTVGGTLTAIVSGSGANYTVEVSGMIGAGTVVVNIPAGAAQGIAGNLSLASISDDNCVNFDGTTPLVTDTPTPTSTPTATLTPPTATVPPPPPAPHAEDLNFDANGVVHTGIPDTLVDSINIRVLYQNGQPTQWLGRDLYNGGSIGNQGVLDLGVQQAVDIFSPNGVTHFESGAVFCLRGEGTLIWLAASGAPRHAEIIGSYEVEDFPGFTCATLFEPGTLVLVRDNPVE